MTDTRFKRIEKKKTQELISYDHSVWKDIKKELFSKIKDIADENNINAVVEGSNADDINDYRPGMRAVSELEILSPLKKV